MLIILANELDTTVSELLGEPVAEPTTDDLKILSEKLEYHTFCRLPRAKIHRRRCLRCLNIIDGKIWSVLPGGAVLLLQSQPVGDHGDELAVGGLALGVGNRVPEILLKGLQVATVPGHLNGVADGQGVIREMQVLGGCNGNLQGISRLVVGMKAEDAISRLKGIDCGGKGTSCPDQFARGLEKAMAKDAQ